MSSNKNPKSKDEAKTSLSLKEDTQSQGNSSNIYLKKKIYYSSFIYQSKEGIVSTLKTENAQIHKIIEKRIMTNCVSNIDSKYYHIYLYYSFR